MGLFSRKKEEKKPEPKGISLPKLPEPPNFSEDSLDQIHQLPSMPETTLGTKFSQNTIKEAVAGEKEDKGFPDADDFEEERDNDKKRMMQKPLVKPISEEVWEQTPATTKFGFNNGKNVGEPVFVRIDNFEEALNIFTSAKKKINEIEHLISEIKKVNEREEQELTSWEDEVRSMKDQIEKADKDIFSKI